jgi:hypothetical protein
MDEAPSPLVDGHELLRRCGYKESSIYRTWIGLAGPRRRHVPLSEAQAHLEGLASKAAGCSKDIAEKRRLLLSELFGVAPEEAPAPDTGTVVAELVDPPAGIAELLGKAELPKVRKVPGELKYSLVDIAHALTGKNRSSCNADVKDVLELYPELAQQTKIVKMKPPGPRASYTTLVADPTTLIEICHRLRGRRARDRGLKRSDEGPDDLYIMSLPAHPGLVKVGRSVNPVARRGQLESGLPAAILGDEGVQLDAVFPCLGALERAVHRRMANGLARGPRRTQCTEWFTALVEDAAEAIRCTRVAARSRSPRRG